MTGWPVSTVRQVDHIDDATAAYRGEVARRIKALRWLLGGERPRAKKTGVDQEPYEMSVVDLQALSGINDEMSVDRINRAERMERSLRRSELRTIVEATGAPDGWFDAALKLREAMVSSRPAELELLADEDHAALDPPTGTAREQTNREAG